MTFKTNKPGKRQNGKRRHVPHFAAERKTMPLTQLDINAALVVIDLQKGIVGLPTVHPASEIVGRAVQLARAFRERGLPVVLVNVTGRAPGRTEAGVPKFSFPPDWTELLPELGQQAGDYLVTKQRVGAFIGTALDDYLRERGVTQVVLAGIATSAGVESTARSAYDLGYNVAFVVDAMTDRDADAHRHCVEKVFPRLGETANAADVLKLVNERSASPTPGE
jgi:nicotinamidase-related amidase